MYLWLLRRLLYPHCDRDPHSFVYEKIRKKYENSEKFQCTKNIRKNTNEFPPRNVYEKDENKGGVRRGELSTVRFNYSYSSQPLAPSATLAALNVGIRLLATYINIGTSPPILMQQYTS